MNEASSERTATAASSYRRVCALASGGVGSVELALREEGRFRRLYAVKRLLDAYRDDEDFRAMFLDEARIAGLIRHPNVVSVLDVGEDERGPFLVMDYIEGVSAALLVSRAVESRVMLPLQVCLRVVMQAAEGLHAAHELRDARGRTMELVHRDVSPQNLLVGFDGITRVTDFGIAKALGRSTRTQTGVLKGKFGYMSPEQLRFEEPDRRSDIFSLGIVLFELASGKRLYKNHEGMDGARRILNEPPPDLGDYRDDVPSELVQLLFSMLAKDVSHRPDDAKRVARAMESILAAIIAEEGRVEVGEFLETAFADERRAQEEKVSAALGAFTGTIALARPEPSEGSRGRTRTIALVAALAVGLGAAAWWIAGNGGAPATVEPAAASAAPAAPVEPAEPAPPAPSAAEEDAPAADVAEVGEPVAPRAAGEAEPGPQAEEQAEEQPAEDGARERRRLRRQRRRQPAPRAGGVPMWDWQ